MTDIAKLGNIMSIWAHPDDEIYSMAGVFLLANKNGQQTVCITATRGEQGVQDEKRWPQARLAAIRSQEMDDSLKILGVSKHYWLDYADGGCRDVEPEDAVSRIAKLIGIHKPDSIFTFGPDGMTGHDDHKTVSWWTQEAVEKSGSLATIYHVITTEEAYDAFRLADQTMNMFFGLDKPRLCSRQNCDLYIELDGQTLDQKMLALRSMPSQTEAVLTKYSEQIRLGCRTEAFVKEGSFLETS